MSLIKTCANEFTDKYFSDLVYISKRKFFHILYYANRYYELPIQNNSKMYDKEQKKLLAIIRILELAFKRDIQRNEDEWEQFCKGLTFNGIYPKLCHRYLIMIEKTL